MAGNLDFFINDPNGAFTPDERARIEDAVGGWDALLAPYNVTITEVPDASLANLIVDTGTGSAAGSTADGVLGCFNGVAGEITILQGWNWFAGADPAQIGPSQYDFQTTVTHEFGHALGLGHSADPNSPMFESLALGQVRRVMSVADLNIPDPPTGADPLMAARPASQAANDSGFRKGGTMAFAGPPSMGKDFKPVGESILGWLFQDKGVALASDGNSDQLNLPRILSQAVDALSSAATFPVAVPAPKLGLSGMTRSRDWAVDLVFSDPAIAELNDSVGATDLIL